MPPEEAFDPDAEPEDEIQRSMASPILIEQVIQIKFVPKNVSSGPPSL